jgi:phosphonate transport system substrate-binding protein
MVPTRRQLLAWGTAALVPTRPARASAPFRLGLTPVFLDNDAAVIDGLCAALSSLMGGSIKVAQRRTYQEVTGLLLEGSVDAAWLCGYPYLQHRDQLALLGAPIWHGQPLYRSYLIVSPEDEAQTLADLEGGLHAFSDPDSNSGWLVTASDLARMGRRPEEFFSRTFFCYGHRNVVRAVAGGLARSGRVDGYVWEALSELEPDLASGTRVLGRSEWLGFPPFVARTDRLEEPDILAFRNALLGVV